jgi:hypothetical protein
MRMEERILPPPSVFILPPSQPDWGWHLIIYENRIVWAWGYHVDPYTIRCYQLPEPIPQPSESVSRKG